METKESKALTDIWDAKERLSEEMMSLPKGERAAYIMEKAKKTADAIRKRTAKRKAA